MYTLPARCASDGETSCTCTPSRNCSSGSPVDVSPVSSLLPVSPVLDGSPVSPLVSLPGVGSTSVVGAGPVEPDEVPGSGVPLDVSAGPAVVGVSPSVACVVPAVDSPELADGSTPWLSPQAERVRASDRRVRRCIGGLRGRAGAGRGAPR